MRYIIRERIFTFGNQFTIEDDRGCPHYNVIGKILSLGNKLNIYDLNGKELLYIEQKLLRFLPEYNIYRQGQRVGSIKKELTIIKARFNITSIYGDFTLDGDVLHHNFNVLRDGKPVAWISKKWISLSDTYSIEIAEGEDHAFILALVIILDQIFYDGNTN